MAKHRPCPPLGPDFPCFFDSPETRPSLIAQTISVTIALPGASGASFDGVTSALRVNANVHAPLLSVTDVFDLASGDLSSPGKID